MNSQARAIDITPAPQTNSGQLMTPSKNRCIKTTCPYCGTGCGIEATVAVKTEQDKTATSIDQVVTTKISGDKSHPGNKGVLCSKGSNLLETLDPATRLLHPQVNGKQVSWDSALDAAAGQIRSIIDQHGPDAFAIYCSGQLLTEDYYVANKLMKGFIGSANIDTNSRLCMSSAVAGHKRAFGSDTVPGCYEDLDQAELMVLTGSNMAWCHPILFQRVKSAKEANPNHKLVVIDPRRTASCDPADLHLALKPGSDATLFNGLLVYLADQGAVDNAFVDQHCNNFEAALQQARSSAADIATVARTCQLDPQDVTTFYRWFSNTPKAVTAFSQGINQSSSGTDKVNAIINLHLASGKIGKAGTGPFSITGQPNAMGGREVGGLANQLAAHMELDNPAHRDLVGRFWNSGNIANKPGHKAVDLFREVEKGTVKAIWILATNPVDSLPDADRVKAALAQCPLVILSDCMEQTDSAEQADIRLPATGWGERNGTVTNAERCISRQSPLFPPSGEAKPDWWAISQIAQRLGFTEAFDYQHSWQIFREHARLSAFENDNNGVLRDFNLSALVDIDAATYDALQPTRWPITSTDNDGQPQGSDRLFGDGQFFSADGKANFIAVQPRLPVNQPDSEYPLTLNTGRIRDQWHTMTRTGLSPRLSSHRPEPFVEVHPAEAERYQLSDGSLARLRSRWGTMLARVCITDTIGQQQLFVPMHWTKQFASQGRMGVLVNPVVDPLSGQPESKQTPVAIEAFPAQWHGFVLSREPLTLPSTYRVRVQGQGFHRYELADKHAVADWRQQAANWLGAFSNLANTDTDSDAHANSNQQWLELSDPQQGVHRTAVITEGRIQAVLVIAKTATQLPEREWLGSLFSNDQLSDSERSSLLSCRPPSGSSSAGAVVCACFGVGKNTIANAITEQGLDSVEAIGSALKAGTNCGSCVPDIKQQLKHQLELNS